MENVLQGNQRICSFRITDYIFRASGGTNFENLPAQRQPWILCCHYLETSLKIQKNFQFLTLFRMGFFEAAYGWEGQKAPLPTICQTYPTMMKLGTVYLT